MKKEAVQGKKILVVGMGRSGKAAVSELHKLGAIVHAQDSNPVEKWIRSSLLSWNANKFHLTSGRIQLI